MAKFVKDSIVIVPFPFPELSLAAIGFSVERGEAIAKENKYFL